MEVAIETATDRLCIALRRNGEAVIERQLEGARRHAAALLPMLQALLDEVGAAPRDIETLALSDGPGSFTGLRVGSATVKALARARAGTSVWTASTLMVRAAGVSAPYGARVLVITSALRGELYAASYRMSLPDSVETVSPPSLATPESLHAAAPDLLVADGSEKTVDRLGDQFAVPMVRGTASRPSAAALLRLVGVAGGAARVLDLDGWEPGYGRPAEAQVRWESAHGKPLADSTRDNR